jgi:hypothetical protein
VSFPVLGAKDPNTVSPYQIDFTGWFKANDDSLNSASIDVVDETGATIDALTDLVVAAVQQTASGIVTVYLSGGTAGRDYYVRVTVLGVRTTPVQISEQQTVVVPVRQL